MGYIIEGETAYVNGEKINGTFAPETDVSIQSTVGNQNNIELGQDVFGFDSVIFNGAEITYSNGIYAKSIIPTVSAEQSDVANAIGLTSDKIVSGNTILGVEGTVEDVNDYISLPEGETSITIANCIKQIPQLDTSNVTTMNNMFANCSSLATIPLLNTSNVTSMTYMFNNCSSLTTIPQLDTSNVTSMYHMFNNCTSLITIPVLDTSSVTGINNMVNNCSSLSNDSLNNILAMLTNATAYTGTKTLKYIGLSETQATTCTTLSNWTACETAGWTTGY